MEGERTCGEGDGLNCAAIGETRARVTAGCGTVGGGGGGLRRQEVSCCFRGGGHGWMMGLVLNEGVNESGSNCSGCASAFACTASGGTSGSGSNGSGGSGSGSSLALPHKLAHKYLRGLVRLVPHHNHSSVPICVPLPLHFSPKMESFKQGRKRRNVVSCMYRWGHIRKLKKLSLDS